jgi:c-di-GMP-binding flagellar brake protein YcgR
MGIFSSKPKAASGAERRRYERVDLEYAAQVFVTDNKGKRLGVLRQLARGGCMLEPEKDFKEGKKYTLIIVDASENLKLVVRAVARYADARRVGLEFENLDVDTAVEIGIIIGKYYQTDSVSA